MKKIFLILMTVIAFSGCSAVPNAIDEKYLKIADDHPAYFEYLYNSVYPERFTVSDDGRIILAEAKENDRQHTDLIEYSMNGDKNKIGEYNGQPECMTFMGDDLYILKILWNSRGTSDGVRVYKINTSGGENEVYTELDIPLRFGYGMSGNENEMYVIGEDGAKENLTCSYPNYIDLKFSIFRIYEGKYEKLPIDFPTAVCAKKTGGAIIAGCDDNGYYVTEYINGKFSEKVYTRSSNGFINAIADIDGEHILYSMFTSANEYILCASDIKNMYNAELMPGTSINGDRIFSAGGYCFFQPILNSDDGQYVIKRIKFSEYYRDNAPINLICSDFSGATPYGCGYTINVIQPSNEEAALKILSHDKDFDICFISTGDDISYAMKNKGTFYPMNDISGVRDYIDKCFPMIKDAFVDENGEIWALPIYSNSNFVFNNCDNADFSKMKSEEFIDHIEALSDDKAKNYLILTDSYLREVLKQYLTENDSFDTPEFRAAAKKIKSSKKMNSEVSRSFGEGLISDEKIVTMFGCKTVMGVNPSENAAVSGIPCISASNALVPNVTFMCINPYSGHLQDTIDYISKIAEYQLKQPDNFVISEENGIYSDNEVVKQIVALSSHAKVYFTYPTELYLNDFRKYLSGEISLDEFIDEADRKLLTYLNE